MIKGILEKAQTSSEPSNARVEVVEPDPRSQNERAAANLATPPGPPLEREASASLGPIKAIYQHMRTLPYALAPLRAFEEQLGVLIKGLEPKGARQEVAGFATVPNRPHMNADNGD